MNSNPISLEGKYITLEPLSIEHLNELQIAGGFSSIFRWFADSYSETGMMERFVKEALDDQQDGVALPFAIVDNSSNEAIGSTRFCNISPEKEKVEIGWTWLTPSKQRTATNTESKLLMLRHAFEEWGCVRVEFETASENVKAREALNRIGAVEEGTLRKHMIIQGNLRDSVYFSILEREWECIKSELELMLYDD